MTDTELQAGDAPEHQEVVPDPDSAPGEAEGKDPAGFTKAINRKHFQLMEEKRRADTLEEENLRLKAEQPQAQRPDIPEVPDRYDDDYAEKLAARDKAVQEQAQFDAKQNARADRREEAQQAAVADSQKALATSMQTYSQRAEKLGVSEQELQVAGNTVAAYGIDDNLVQHILEDEQGPLITAYLAKHPEEIEALRGLPVLHAAVRISTHIKDQLGAVKQNTPAPVDGLSGGGAPPADEGPAGVEYS